MKSVLTLGLVSIVAILTSRCSSTNQPQELNYTKQVSQISSAPSCSGKKELKGTRQLQKTFTALLGSSEASHFVNTNHNHFTTLDQLAARPDEPESVRAYLKILHHLAEDAARSCSRPGVEVKSSCRCGNLAEAQALLARAVPVDHCELAPGLAEELAIACQQDYRVAVSSLFSSLILVGR